MTMRWLDALERRFGAWSIPQFPLFIVAANGLIYLLGQSNPLFVERLKLVPEAIRLGEWWRPFTFLFIPPMSMSPIFLALWLWLLYQYAQALEQAWGEFRFCVFYLLGALATVITAVFIVGEQLSNIPLNTTLFLAMATLYPDVELLLFFILPVKIKVLAWIVWTSIAFSFVFGSNSGRIAIASSLFNYAAFFGADILEAAKLKWQVWKNRRRFRDSTKD